MHYFQHNIADYRKDTGHLTLLEHGAYRQLLDQYYLNEAPLPLDENRLMRLLSARNNDEIRAVLSVLADFFEKTDQGYIHKRCEAEIEAFRAKSELASKSAKIRWDKQQFTEFSDRIQAVSERNAKRVRTHSEPNTNHKPLTINHKPLTNTIKPLSDFDMFWIAYPKKVGKEAARKAWAKANPDIATVLNTLEWQKVSPQWFKNNGLYIPNPSTWLNQHRWEDQKPEEQTF
jgi:uncharacterized protein YdaU (DUF1376 family)